MFACVILAYDWNSAFAFNEKHSSLCTVVLFTVILTVSNLLQQYGPLFKISLLEQQLLYIYRDTDFYKASSQELLDYIIQLNLQSCFSEVFKLILLNATVAISSSSVERFFLA